MCIRDSLQPGDYPRAGPTVRVFTLVAEAAIAFVNDQCNRPHGLDGCQHPFKIGFGRADPLGTKILERNPGQPGLLEKSLDDKCLAGTRCV